MSILAQGTMIVYLLAASVTDIFRKKLSILFLLAGIIPAGILTISEYFGNGNSDTVSFILSHVSGLAVGAVFLLISAVTKEGFGKADAVLLCICGAAAGVVSLISVILFSFLLGAVYSIAMLAMGRLTRKDKFAFVPFILLGYVMMLLLK